MSNHNTEPKTSRKFNKLAHNLNIELIKESKKTVFDIVVSIDNGKDFKIEPVD